MTASAVDCAKCELPVIDRATLEQHASEKYDNSKCSKESEKMFAIVLNVIGNHCAITPRDPPMCSHIYEGLLLFRSLASSPAAPESFEALTLPFPIVLSGQLTNAFLCNRLDPTRKRRMH